MKQFQFLFCPQHLWWIRTPPLLTTAQSALPESDAVVGNHTDSLFTAPTEITAFPGGRRRGNCTFTTAGESVDERRPTLVSQKQESHSGCHFYTDLICPSPSSSILFGRVCCPGLSCEMKDGVAAAITDHRTFRVTRIRVHPGLSLEMVPAWANLHNTLLTPLLYSSITARQLLQVRAFV